MNLQILGFESNIVRKFQDHICHALILLDTPSYRKDPSMGTNEPLKALPKEGKNLATYGDLLDYKSLETSRRP